MSETIREGDRERERERDRDRDRDREPPGRSGETATRRTIGHDEFDPIGTLALIGLYLLVLVLMWLFVYFVEFLGNGPTVVGAIATVVGAA